MEAITKNDCQKIIDALRETTKLVKQLKEVYRPALNGEKYLTNAEVCKMLKTSSRTLQEYRDSGLIPFIGLPGKILYKESDIMKVLEDNYAPSITQIQDSSKWSL